MYNIGNVVKRNVKQTKMWELKTSQSYPNTSPIVRHSMDTHCWGAGCSSLDSRCIVCWVRTTSTATKTAPRTGFSVVIYSNTPITRMKPVTVFDLRSHSAGIQHNWCWTSRHKELKRCKKNNSVILLYGIFASFVFHRIKLLTWCPQ